MISWLSKNIEEDSGTSFPDGESYQGDCSKVQGVFESRNYSDDEKQFLRVSYEKFEKEVIKPLLL